MTEGVRLPDHAIKAANATGETGMGYIIGNAVLLDGTVVPDCVLVWDDIVSARSTASVPFTGEMIQTFIPTHRKWNG